MGWLFMKHLSGHDGPKEYLDAQFSGSSANSKTRILRSTVKNKRVYYAAVERIELKDNARSVFAIVCLLKWTPRSTDGHIFGYKYMDETVGPYEYECPKTILNLLTETQYAYAIEWRNLCRDRIAQCNERRKKTIPKPGDTLILDQPVRFTDGYELSQFKVIGLPDRRGLIYQSLENGGYYRISKVRDLSYQLEPIGTR